MNVQAAPPTYTPAGGAIPLAGRPPVLGQQVPGMSDGLAAQGGLSVLTNPMAEQLQSMGRDEDTMLVHMTPEEVNSLQGLAMAAGGSLTINPNTGLPEAGFLKRLLPLIAGVGLNFLLPGAGMAGGKLVAALGGKAATAGLLTGAASTAITGNLQKGLMAGLGAFGGASLAGGAQAALGAKAAGAKTAAAGVPPIPVADAAGQAAKLTVPGSVPGMTGTTLSPAMAKIAAQEAAIQGGGIQISPSLSKALAGPIKTPGALGRFGQGFAETARGGMTGLAGKAAPFAAGIGALSTISNAATPTGGFRTPGGQMDNSYQGPYTAQRRRPVFAGTTEDILAGDGGQQQFFDVDIPEIYNMQGQVVQPGSHTKRGTMIYQNVLNPRARKGQPMYSSVGTPFMGFPEEEEGFAEGGTVDMRDGSFVVDARTVSELGNGSSNAGIEMLSRMGGRPVRGPGDGVSDSVRASIGGKQEARVARDEVIFQPEAVRRLGGGSDAKGTQKLYAMMDKAHKARKKAKRGQDTKLRKGLA